MPRMLTLTASYRKLPEGGYMARVLELPGAITQGETLEKARKNLQDAVTLLFETRRQLDQETTAGDDVIREPLRFTTEP
jgi:predicted RNase H-like HicB family nuclease